VKAFYWIAGIAFAVVGGWVLYAPYYGKRTGQDMFGKGPPSVVMDHPPAATPPSTPSSAPAVEQTGLIRGAELGDSWPFTVSEGVVSCVGRGGIGFAIFTAPDGTRYALNGLAKAPDIMTRYNLHQIDAIWRRNPEVPELRINIGPAIDRALELCPK
jgi:hypothetical protein